jgi:ElaB/YqjD/DUF883 family membrane-anchored ribosome-binding protein
MGMNFLNRGKDAEGMLAEQIQSLQDELRALRKQASKRGSQSYNDARKSAADLVEDIRDSLAPAVDQLRRQARHAGTTARENPTATAAVGLLALGLVAAFFATRSSSR